MLIKSEIEKCNQEISQDTWSIAQMQTRIDATLLQIKRFEQLTKKYPNANYNILPNLIPSRVSIDSLSLTKEQLKNVKIKCCYLKSNFYGSVNEAYSIAYFIDKTLNEKIFLERSLNRFCLIDKYVLVLNYEQSPIKEIINKQIKACEDFIIDLIDPHSRKTTYAAQILDKNSFNYNKFQTLVNFK